MTHKPYDDLRAQTSLESRQRAAERAEQTLAEERTPMTTFDEYQARSRATAVYPRVRLIIGDNPPIEAPWLYPLLGLVGEVGELTEKYKKVIRDDQGVMDDATRRTTMLESGDVLWYLTQLAAHGLSVDLGKVAEENLAKLASRKQRDVLHGEGDTR